jgi:hypothetical protein
MTPSHCEPLDSTINSKALDTGPRIRLEGGQTWAAPAGDNVDSWLDIKGAFLGKNGPYQPKDPIERAIKLCETGRA